MCGEKLKRQFIPGTCKNEKEENVNRIIAFSKILN